MFPSARDTALTRVYREYIACLNAQDWPALGRFVHENVSHNGNRIGVAGYRQMLERDFVEIPDLCFTIELLVADSRYVASRLRFDCTPRKRFVNLDVDGTRVSFAENVFYEFRERKIIQVWSIIDKTAIEAQLPARSDSDA
jgi:predicted ester cyclase